MAKVLLLGGTGAMGVYLIPELINLGFDVFVTSRSSISSDNNMLTYIQGNAHDNNFLVKVLADRYDAIVDFMSYSTKEFCHRYELLLKSTRHYIFLSSYRVFAESDIPLTEKSPRLLDVSDDLKYLATDEYALAKARQENALHESENKNWTIVRPTITYSKTRFQLCTLEAGTIIFRAICNCSVILPQEMMPKQTTMSWGGDVAKMIAMLVLNKNALCEDFNVCTSEHQSWGEVTQYYKKLIGLIVVPVSLNKYIKVIGSKYQIIYDRMYDRIMDNSKILKITGIQKESITSVSDGLTRELSNISEIIKHIKIDYEKNAKMDRIAHCRINLKNATLKEKIIYYSSFMGLYKFLVFLYRVSPLGVYKQVIKQ